MSDVVRALLYLEGASLAGKVRQRVRRLKQPKYLVGAIAGVAYMYWFVFRNLLAAPNARNPFLQAPPPELVAIMLPLGAVVVLAIMATAWLFASDRAALRFSEAETGFLFAAPISRTGLIHFSVLRSQALLFVSVFLISLLLRRGRAVGVNPLQYATALWLVVATVRLHFLGASFTRERLLDLGLRPMWRRAGVVVLLVALGGACVAWARAHVPPPGIATARGLSDYLDATLGHGPASIVLTPFRWLVAPLLAADTRAFVRALPAAVALLAAHYAWVVMSQVSFEEATIALARRRADTVQAAREGRFRLRAAPTRARRAPFALAPRGVRALAFLWSGLIAAGPLWRLRTWLAGAAIAVGVTWWLGTLPAGAAVLRVIAILALSIAGWSSFVGPMFVQGRLRRTLDQLDVLRATPLRGWEIALGQLLTPIAMLVGVQTLLLFVAACAYARMPDAGWLTPGLLAAGALTVALLAPLLCAVMLCVPFGGMLLFPGWSGSGRGGGIDVMGQRLIFGGVYLVVLAVSLTPAALFAGGFVWVLQFAGWPLAIAVAAIAAAAVLALEVAMLVRWLGGRIERFDVSTDLR